MPSLKGLTSSGRRGSGTNELLKVGVLLAGVAVAAVMGFAFYGQWWAGVVFIPYSVIFVRKNLKLLAGRNRRKNEEEFIDGITSLTFALQAGYSVENSFMQAAAELNKLHNKSAMAEEFKLVAVRAGRNERVELALREMGERLEIEAIKEFADIFAYAMESGGNLVAVMRRTADQMKEKHEINREIDTLISGKKFEQKILCAMPLFITFYLRVSAAEFVAPLYGNVTGAVCMTVCAIVYLASIRWAEKITDISV